MSQSASTVGAFGEVPDRSVRISIAKARVKKALAALNPQMDASLLSETDRLHICEEWSADKFNNDCSRHVLELDRNQTLSNIQGTIRNETSDFSKVESAKSICLGYMQLCQVPRFKTPCPNHEKIPNWDPSISAEHPECEESR